MPANPGLAAINAQRSVDADSRAAQARQLFEDGALRSDIAEKLGVSRMTVWRLLNREAVRI
ncbi:hypothetical protein LCGC14_1752250 [marine sediment metagenome]|uniref:Uncharacterized protein n=1 Tax=marine sediment metagenome TaxID=412755 RepID=A0A0F9H3G2_9ZZZZ